MENEDRAKMEAQHQKELEILRDEVVRLTSQLEYALGSKSKEAKFSA